MLQSYYQDEGSTIEESYYLKHSLSATKSGNMRPNKMQSLREQKYIGGILNLKRALGSHQISYDDDEIQ